MWPCEDYFGNDERRTGSTPDGFYRRENGALGVVEVKVVASPIFKKQWDDAPPLAYSMQTLWAMLHVGATEGLVLALEIDAFKLAAHEFEVPLHDGMRKRMFGEVAKFWHKVDAGKMPVFDYERDGALLRLLYPDHVPGKVIDLTGDNELPGLLDQRALLIEQAKSVERLQNAIEAEIIAKLKDAEAAHMNGWRLTYKTQTRKECVMKATKFRVLRAKRLEEKIA